MRYYTILLSSILCFSVPASAEPISINPSEVNLPTFAQAFPTCGFAMLTEPDTVVLNEELAPNKIRYHFEWLVTNRDWAQRFPGSIFGLVQFQITCTTANRSVDDPATFNRVQAEAAHERAVGNNEHAVHAGEEHVEAIALKNYGILENAYQLAVEHDAPTNFGMSRHYHIDVFGSYETARVHILVHYVGFDLSDNPELVAPGAILTASDGSAVITTSPLVIRDQGGYVAASSAEQNLDYVSSVLSSLAPL